MGTNVLHTVCTYTLRPGHTAGVVAKGRIAIKVGVADSCVPGCAQPMDKGLQKCTETGILSPPLLRKVSQKRPHYRWLSTNWTFECSDVVHHRPSRTLRNNFSRQKIYFSGVKIAQTRLTFIWSNSILQSSCSSFSSSSFLFCSSSSSLSSPSSMEWSLLFSGGGGGGGVWLRLLFLLFFRFFSGGGEGGRLSLEI